MPEPSDAALPSGPGGQKPRGWQIRVHRGRLPLLAALALVIAGTALLGVAAGFIWAAVAPRALIEVVGRGSADVVNPETSAYIAADGWFSLLSVAGGVVSGLAGYLVAVRRHGALAMAGILAGALAAALIARWIGQQPGQAAADHSLALGRPGTMLEQPLTLGGIGPLAFWPLAAGLVAGGIELTALVRARLSRPQTRYGVVLPGPPPQTGVLPGPPPQAGPFPGPLSQTGPLPPGPPGRWPPEQPQPGPPEPRG